MHYALTRSGSTRLALAGMMFAAAVTACSGSDNSTNPPATTHYLMKVLVAVQSTVGATTVDQNLVNPWGLAFGGTGTLWVSNNHTGTSTLYDIAGNKNALVVTVPTVGGAAGGAPTGIVFNATADFVIPVQGGA